jgi:hypothetical protein
MVTDKGLSVASRFNTFLVGIPFEADPNQETDPDHWDYCSPDERKEG